MMWVVMVVGLAAQPTFLGEYKLYTDCTPRAEHVNKVYGDMVHAHCMPADKAVAFGYEPKRRKGV